jgi:hypothetical protein
MEFWRDTSGKGLTANRLAHLLRRFHISPKTVDFQGVSAKGYEAKDFSDAFSRYLSSIQNVGTSEPAPTLDETTFSKRRTVEEPTFQKVTEPPVAIDVRRSDVSKEAGHEVKL